MNTCACVVAACGMAQRTDPRFVRVNDHQFIVLREADVADFAAWHHELQGAPLQQRRTQIYDKAKTGEPPIRVTPPAGIPPRFLAKRVTRRLNDRKN
jgi:hypothetical protein